jgi:hypothetical protein
MNPTVMDTRDDYMADDEQEQEQEQEHTEESRNVRELTMLRREIETILERGICPPAAWYEHRYHNLETYAELGWSSMAHRFQRIDRYIQDTSMNILNNLEDLIEEFHRKRHFHLRHYQHLLDDIQNLWNYYKMTYIGNETDPDVGDLIVDLTHMMSNL